jgi:hypothetical protein
MEGGLGCNKIRLEAAGCCLWLAKTAVRGRAGGIRTGNVLGRTWLACRPVHVLLTGDLCNVSVCSEDLTTRNAYSRFVVLATP